MTSFSFFLVLTILFSLSTPIASASTTSDAQEDFDIPLGYTYYTSTKHDIGWEVDSITTGITGTVAIVTGGFHPLIGIISGIIAAPIASWFANLVVGDHLKGYYYDYVYECDDPGIYPYIYFHIYVFYAQGTDGNYYHISQNTCYEYALLPR